MVFAEAEAAKRIRKRSGDVDDDDDEVGGAASLRRNANLLRRRCRRKEGKARSL